MRIRARTKEGILQHSKRVIICDTLFEIKGESSTKSLSVTKLIAKIALAILV